jgi:CRISPR-associated protein Csb2
VTPVALDRNPGDLAAGGREGAEAIEIAREIVAQGCQRVGLPRPAWVEISRRSVFDGTSAARSFMPFPRKRGAIRRVCVHVEIAFQEPVSGPVLLGAGRYRGLGLLRPVAESRSKYRRKETER